LHFEERRYCSPIDTNIKRGDYELNLTISTHDKQTSEQHTRRPANGYFNMKTTQNGSIRPSLTNIWVSYGLKGNPVPGSQL
jgi:hypothetical protein